MPTSIGKSLSATAEAADGEASRVVVLVFPSLAQQGEMLNRVAALVEKAGLPRDRVLSDAELAEAIRQRGETAATFYYGHDYSASALARFFVLADRDRIRLNEAEERLRRLLDQLGLLSPGAAGALISISADLPVMTRRIILHHELSHGAFFTDARYAEYARRFWRDKLSAVERSRLGDYLGNEGYDTGNEELMSNEMQAYVMFTHAPAFFDPAAIGMSARRRAELEAMFRNGMPDMWMRSFPTEPPLSGAASISAATCAATAPCR